MKRKKLAHCCDMQCVTAQDMYSGTSPSSWYLSVSCMVPAPSSGIVSGQNVPWYRLCWMGGTDFALLKIVFHKCLVVFVAFD